MGTNKGYTGQYADPLSGFDYYNARYYDPVCGRRLIKRSTITTDSGL